MQRITRIALPKGRLMDVIGRCTARLGLLPESARSYSRRRNTMMVKTLKTKDIPLLVANGDMDIGFVADEWATECSANIARLFEVPGYQVSIATVIEESNECADLADFWRRAVRPIRVVTEYPRTTEAHLKARSLRGATILHVSGAAEAYAPDLADLVVDCVETGATARANGLRILDIIHVCKLHLAANPAFLAENHSLVEMLVKDVADSFGDPSDRIESFDGVQRSVG